MSHPKRNGYSRTLIINAVSSKAGGGLNDLAQTIRPLLRVLPAEGLAAQVFVVDEGAKVLNAVECEGAKIVTVPAESPLARARWEWRDLPRIVRREKPEAVFHFSNFIFRDLPVPQVTVLRSPTFFSGEYARMQRRGIYQKLRYRLGGYYSRKTIERGAAVFCISETHRRQIVESVGPVAEKVRVAHLGVSVPPQALQLRGLSRNELLAQLPPEPAERLKVLLTDRSKVLVNVAHYYSHKNLGTLLKAVDELSRNDPTIGLILTAGITSYGGPQNEQTRRERTLAKDLQSRGVLVDLGPVTKEWVWVLLAMGDLFVFPSALESFGHPLLEAMGMGIPVVAADTEIHREICGDAAEFHAVFDPASLASAVRCVLDEPQRAARLVRLGEQNVERFSWQTHVELLAEAIRELVRN